MRRRTRTLYQTPPARSALPSAFGVAVLCAFVGCGEASDAPGPGSAPPSAEAGRPAPAEPTEPTPAANAPPTREQSGADVAAGDPARGQEHYQLYCAACHGTTGQGDGPVAQSLDPKPARHNDGAYMNALSDDHLLTVIERGGAAVGMSRNMAAWGGVLDDQGIRDVVAYIRSLADPPYRP